MRGEENGRNPIQSPPAIFEGFYSIPEIRRLRIGHYRINLGSGLGYPGLEGGKIIISLYNVEPGCTPPAWGFRQQGIFHIIMY